uniref:Transposase n=1 Tax=Acrobeloides nanus TaxID=290746 RepID=A0A914DW87_9BILA
MDMNHIGAAKRQIIRRFLWFMLIDILMELKFGRKCKSEVDPFIYCGQLENTRRALRNRRIPVVFLDDNAKPHRSRQTMQKIQNMGWEHLEHPPYSPDLSPSDFYLFRSLEHWLRGKKFRTTKEMRQSLTEFFDSKDREWYRRGIHQLEEQWKKVIKSGGEYFDY